jgi:hypothetical protein
MKNEKNTFRDLYRINKFKRSYKHRSKSVKDKNADLLADSHNVWSRRKKYFSQSLNVRWGSDARQIEIYTQLSHWYLIPDLFRLKLLLRI